MNKIQAVRGMNDVLPVETPRWHFFEAIARHLMASYGYQEIRFPVLEQTQLFKRSIGEVTDIVEKEMYTFEDRNGDSLSLRPEGTACCVRAAEQGGLLYNQTQKLWYLGPMYRHERPQKGRYRQFWQLGVESFGMADCDIEAELLLMCADLWRGLGIAGILQLEINNLGSSPERAAYGAALRAFLLPLRDKLDEDSRRRLDSNVLRILDSKVDSTRELLVNAPRMADYVGAESSQQFLRLQSMLDQAGVSYRINPALVRGLDYYNGLVFEWTTDQVGAQATVCAGGRYDNLTKQLGGSATPAFGFAMGVERLLLILEAANRFPVELARQADVYLALVGQGVQAQGLLLAHELRQQFPSLRILTHCGGGKYNMQLKKAFACGARCAVILEGDSNQQQAKFKVLDNEGATRELPVSAVASELARFFNLD